MLKDSALNTGRTLDVNNDLEVNKPYILQNLTITISFMILSICNKDALTLAYMANQMLIYLQAMVIFILGLERESFILLTINLRTVFDFCRCI